MRVAIVAIIVPALCMAAQAQEAKPCPSGHICPICTDQDGVRSCKVERSRGNSRSCPGRQRRWISRRRAMLRCRHLRRRSARSFCLGPFVMPLRRRRRPVTATTPYRIFSLTFLMPVSPANVRHIGRSIRRSIYTPKISKGRLFWAAYGAIKCADRHRTRAEAALRTCSANLRVCAALSRCCEQFAAP